MKPAAIPHTRAARPAAPVCSHCAALERELQETREQLAVVQADREVAERGTREALRELEISREQYAELYDFAPNAYVVLDGNGFIRDANLTGAELLGEDRLKLRDTPFMRFVAMADHRNFLRHLSRCRHSRHPTRITSDLHLSSKHGTYLVHMLSTPAANKTATPPRQLRFRTALVDLTEIRRAELALHESEARYRLLFEQNPCPMFIMGESSLDILDVNETALRLYGYSREAFLAMTIKDIHPPEDVPAALAAIRANQRQRRAAACSQSSLNAGLPVNVGEWRHCKRDGTVFDVEITSSALSYAGPPARLVLVNDITARKQAEAALRESETRFRSLFENSPDALFLGTPEGRILDANPAACAMFERSKAAFLRLGRAAVPAVNKAELSEAIKERARTGHVRREMAYLRKDGSEIETELISVIIPQPSGEQRTLVAFRDITARKRAEVALRESEERYRTIFNQAADAVVVFDPQTLAFVDFNDETCRRLGYSRQDFARLKLSALEARESAAEVKRHVRQFTTSRSEVFETQLRARSGRPIDMEVRAKAIYRGGRKLIHCIWRDITARKQTEAALRESEIRYRAIFDQAADSVVVFDPKTLGIVDFNDEAYRRMGYSRRAFARLKISDLNATDSAAAVKRRIRTIPAGGVVVFETQQRTRSGTLLDIEVRSRTIRLGGRTLILGMWRDITARKRVEEELRRRVEEIETLMEIAPAAIWVAHDPKCQKITGNRQANEIYEASARENVSANVPSGRRFIQAGRALTASELPMQIAVATGKEVLGAEFEVLLPGGRQITLLGNAQPLRGPDGKVRGCIAAFIDISARKWAEEAVGRAAQEWTSTFDGVSDAVWVMDLEQRILRCNKAAAELFGKTVPEMVGRPCWEIVHGTHQPIAQCPVARMQRSGKRETMELTLGGRWYQVVVDPLRDTHGALRGAIHAISDITARKQTEETLRHIAVELERRVTERTAEVQRLAAIVQRSSELISLATPDLRGVFINDAGARLLGIAAADIDRYQWSDFLPADEQLRFHTQIMPIVRQGRVWQGELRYRHFQTGALSYGAAAMFPILDPTTNQVRYLATTSVDISDRKELEHQVLEISEREQRRIGHDLHDSVGQQLAAVKFLSGTLSRRLAKGRLSGAPAAAQIERELQHAMEEVRAIARGLHPIRPDGESLMSALYELAAGVNRLFKLPCHFSCPRRVLVHDFQAATHLFRIAQEAVSNATRHAHARHIWLRLGSARGGIRLRIEDDGCGLPAGALRPRGMGLRIMNYRASVIRANFNLARRPGGGTCITCDWKPSTTQEKAVSHASQ